jgi:hypothetical protein
VVLWKTSFLFYCFLYSYRARQRITHQVTQLSSILHADCGRPPRHRRRCSVADELRELLQQQPPESGAGAVRSHVAPANSRLLQARKVVEENI